VITGVIGLGAGLTTNYFQNYAEQKTAVLNKRIELLNSLQENVTRYFEFDAETDIENNYQVFKLALKKVVPTLNFDTNTIYHIPSFPTVEQLKEHKDIRSNLERLTESIDVYFGDKIGNEAAGLLKALNEEPIHTLDIYSAVNYVTKLNEKNAVTLENIAMFLKPYLSPAPHSTDVNRSLNGVITDIKCVIKKSIKIESTPFQNNSDPVGVAITILPTPSD
jgi:hypothetical protein